MQLKCYLCDSNIDANPHPFKIGLREEVICENCYTKMMNRRKALGGESDGSVK